MGSNTLVFKIVSLKVAPFEGLLENPLAINRYELEKPKFLQLIRLRALAEAGSVAMNFMRQIYNYRKSKPHFPHRSSMPYLESCGASF